MFCIDKKNIGAVIRNARKKAKLKQYQVAEMAGFSEKHLSRIENGKYLPKLEHFLILTSILNLSLKDFGFIEPDNTNEEKTKLINKIMSLDSMTLNIYKTSLESAEQIVKIIKSKQET